MGPMESYTTNIGQDNNNGAPIDDSHSVLVADFFGRPDRASQAAAVTLRDLEHVSKYHRSHGPQHKKRPPDPFLLGAQNFARVATLASAGPNGWVLMLEKFRSIGTIPNRPILDP